MNGSNEKRSAACLPCGGASNYGDFYFTVMAAIKLRLEMSDLVYLIEAQTVV